MMRRLNIYCIGCSHKTADSAVRDILYIDDEQLRLSMPRVQAQFQISEMMVLSTCNRFEIYLAGPPERIDEQMLFDLLLALHTGNQALARFNQNELEKLFYVYSERAAVTHVMNVASGIDSLVIGETQITGQFKDAIELARELETVGPILSRFAQEALALTKSVRTKTAIGQRSVSVGSAAAELVNLVFGDISKHDVAIVGAGEMARLAAQHILKQKPRQLFIANRTVQKAVELCRELGAGKACSLDEMPRLLVDADVVIAATSAVGFLIQRNGVEHALAARRGSPLCLVDIAMPRDIDPAVEDFENVYHFDIDDLQQVVDRNFEGRRQALEEASGLVTAAAEQFDTWMMHQHVRPLLADFDRYIADLMSQELQKTLRKGSFSNLTAEQLKALDTMLRSVQRKIVADAGEQIRNPPDGYFKDQLAEALGALFLSEGKAQKEKNDASA
jgi:glutamyl-tRNA reductase